MPKKIRELKAMLLKAGFIQRTGKGSHTIWIVVHLPDFPFQDIHTHGNTYEEAAKHGQQVIDSYLQLYQENNQPLPQPKNPLKYIQVA